MAKRKSPEKKRRLSGAFWSFLKWPAVILLTLSLWILILTDNTASNSLPLKITVTALSAVTAIYLLYLLNTARINTFGAASLVDDLSGTEFEHFAADVLKRSGFSKISVTKSSGDFGADIVALDREGYVWVFQCKRYSTNIGNTPIQEVTAAKQHYNAQYAGVITNQHFTPAAHQLAEENDVLLIEREKLLKMARKKRRIKIPGRRGI